MPHWLIFDSSNRFSRDLNTFLNGFDREKTAKKTLLFVAFNLLIPPPPFF